MSRQWTLGEVFVLRHAGFPFDWLEELGCSQELLGRVAALLDVEQQLVELGRQAGGEKAAARVESELARGVKPTPPRGADSSWAEGVARYAEVRQRVEELHARDRAQLRARLHARARDARVQEAVFLSSPDMYENVWSRYVATEPGPENANARRVERQVYSYLQRFCAKNETTSFFGPMGYGEIEGDGEVEVVRLPAAPRRTFLAFWAVQELAKAITAIPEIWLQLPLRVNPIFRIEGGRVLCPSMDLDVAIAPELVEIIEAVRSSTDTVEALVERLGRERSVVEELVLSLLKSTVLVRELRYRADDLEAFQNLRAAVDALPASDFRERWHEHLARLDGLRAQFEVADLSERRRLLPRIEAAFTELTGVPARRGEGMMYMDRLVLYEESGSRFRLRLGRQYAQRLAEALSPGLELSAAFGERIQQGLVRGVREKLGSQPGPHDFLQYAATLQPSDGDSQTFKTLEPVSLPASSLEDGQVPVELCGRSAPGGRYALPDVCLGGRADGSFDVLLARVHHHLLVWNWLGAFYEDRPRMERVARRWLEGEPSAASLVEFGFTRRNKGFYNFPGPRILYSTEEPLTPGRAYLFASELQVTLGADGPALRGPDGRRLFLYLPLADFTTNLPYGALAHPLVLHAPLRADAAHLPRLRVGAAAYQRERWTVELPNLEKLGGLELLLAVQREKRRHRWPRFLFGRVPGERKPFFLDTDSPFSVELLRHLARDVSKVSFEEMLPAPDELWLSDEQGRYTFELRMQAERWSDAEP